MAKVRPIKTNFTRGEVDPLITMRSDLELIPNGAALMRNVLPFPQGGFRRRDGLQTMTRIPIRDPGLFGLINFSSDLVGSGYAVSEIVTISGGTFTTAATIRVDSVGGSGQILTFTVLGEGRYSIPPAPGGATSSSGSGLNATFDFDAVNREFKPISLTSPTIGTPGTGYTVGDFLQATGGTLTTIIGVAPTSLVVRVASITGASATGPVNEVEVVSIGDYEVVPEEPAATTGGTGSNATLNWIEETQDVVKLIDFPFSINQNYIIAFTVGRWYVFRKEDTGSGPNQLVHTSTNGVYDNAQLNEITWTQSLDVMIVFHNELPIRKLIRADETDWTFEEFFPENAPTFAFGLKQTAELNVAFASAVVGSSRTVTANLAVFTGTFEDVGKYIRVSAVSDPLGNNFASYLRITAFINTVSVTAMFIVLPVLTPPTTASYTVGGTDWLLEEVQFSKEHGYPRCGQFFQGRLITAATTDQPQTVFTSRSGDIDDFNSGTSADDLGIVATLGSGTRTTIQNINAGRHLQFFTDNAEYYIPNPDGGAITPSNIEFIRTTTVGSVASIPVFDVDGVVYFTQRGGRSFRGFEFIDGVKAYDAPSEALVASHLIRNPNDAAFKKSLNTEDGNYIWVVNQDDFSLAAFGLLKAEEINAWSLQTTEGKFKGVAVSDQDTYFHVTRNPGGTINYSGFFRDLQGEADFDSNPQGVALSNDGTKMFVVSNATDTVYEYALNFPESLERAVFTENSFDLSGQTSDPKDCVISPDGFKMFIIDKAGAKILEYDMAEPNSLADGNVTDSGFTLDFSTAETDGTGFDISDDGINLFLVGTDGGKVNYYTLNTAFTFEDGSSLVSTFNVEDESTDPQDVKFSNDGFRFFIVDGTKETVFQYIMTTAFDILTASFTKDTFFTGDQDSSPLGMAFGADGLTLLIAGSATDTIYEYDLSNPFQFGAESDWIEFFQKDLKFDAAIAQFSGITKPVTEINGQVQLAHEPVGIIIDDVVHENQVVDANGTLIFPVPAHYNFQIGLPFPNIIVKDENNVDVDTGFNVLVKTLPADVLLASGTTMGKKKRVPRCTVRFVETQGFYLQDFLVPFRNLPQVLDRPIPLQTGEKELTGLLGYDNFGQITIAQREPLAMTVLGLGYDLSTGT